MLKPEQVTAIIDNREQRPLNLAPLQSCRGTLQTADYSVLGLEHVIAVERKSLDDLIQCVTRERDRFEKEIQRMMAYPCKALVVEANWSDIENHNYKSKTNPNSIMGSLMSWLAQGVPVVMIGNHDRASIWVARMLFMAAKRRYEENYPFNKIVDNQQAAV